MPSPLPRLACALAAALLATAAPASEPRRPYEVSLTVSGGVSLGAYEAGQLYGAAPLHGDRKAALRLLTGASAGSLNSLLAILDTCGEGALPPSRSLYWTTWVPVGFDQLYVPGAVKPLGVFSREWLERQAVRIEEAWGRGLRSDCDVVLGVAVTRLQPRTLQAAQGRLELPRMEEKFAVRIQGRGPGRPPRATNYAAGAAGEPLLVTDEAGEIAFPALRDLIFASMSFPVAFPPQELRTCTGAAAGPPWVCLPAQAGPAGFIDGGVFDNAPLRLAVRLARTGLQGAPGPLRWRDVPDPAARATPEEVIFAFIDADATDYPAALAAPAPARRAPRESLPRELGTILGALVDTARSKELATLLEEEPGIAGRIVLPRRRFPAASAPMLAFLGFFDRELRAFDFALGMYDAARSSGAEPPPPAAAGEAPDPGWLRLACMRAVFDGEAGAAEACAAGELADFRALLQVSLDQLYAACRAEAEAGPAAPHAPWGNPHCERAARGEPPPRVPGLPAGAHPGWRPRPRESELAYTLRLLGAYGFRFHDLGLPPGRGDLALARIRTSLERAATALARAQPAADRAAVAFAAKLAADTVAYLPPDRVLHLTMGPTETELGFSWGAFGARWLPRGLRAAGAVGLRGLGQAFSSRDTEPFAVLTTGGVELQPPGSTSLGQLRVGLRAGWLFAADDRWGGGLCADRGSAAVSACSRPVLQGLVGFTALERFRLQLVGEWYPGSVKREVQWSLAPGIGLEVGF